jgi:Predicted dithiol-disulfide isomerase involved in polyketide biosynthesis
MATMEIFFDYICPDCRRGNQYLLELLPKAPPIDLIWRPWELRPRPAGGLLHTDLCFQGLFFAQDQGADLFDYHGRMYQAVRDQADIEDVGVLTSLVEGLLDRAAFRKALEDRTYLQAQLEANHYAREQKVEVAPTFIMGGRRLGYKTGVSKEQLAEFIGAR